MRQLTPSWPTGSLGLAAAALLVLLCGGTARAQNEAFQAFFTNSCANATGALATQCGFGVPAGNISTDSESSLNPGQAVSTVTAAVARAKAKARAIQERLEERRDEAAGQEGAAAGDATSVDFGRFSLLVNGRVTVVDRERNRLVDSERAFDGEIYTAQIGGDYRLTDQTVLGALFGYDRTETEFDRFQPIGVFTPPQNDGETEANSFSLNVFASHNFTENIYVDGNAGFTYTDYSFGRNGAFQDSTRAVLVEVNAEGDTDGTQVSVGVGAGYDYYSGALTVGPYARVNYVHTTVSAYTEKDLNNSGLAMRVDPDSRESLTTVVGLRASYAISTDFGVIVPQARLEYEHEFEFDAQTTNTSFVLDPAGTVLTVRGDDPDRNYYNVGVGVSMVLPNGWLPFVDYEALLDYADVDRHRFTFGLRKEL